MPIVRKLDDLGRFIFNLMESRKYKNDEIGIMSLRWEISKEFGISDYIIKSIHKKLLEFGFLQDLGYGRFKMSIPKNEPDSEESKAKEEADELLSKFQ